MNSKIKLGLYIKDKRRSKYLTQGELCKILRENFNIKIKTTMLSGIETGKKELRLDVAQALVKIIDADYNYMISLSDLLRVEDECRQKYGKDYKIIPRRC